MKLKLCSFAFLLATFVLLPHFVFAVSGWTAQSNSGERFWQTVASSADGAKLVVALGQFAPGYIYTSTDSGVNWTEQTSSGSKDWRDLASSADGAKLIAAAAGVSVFTSADSGVTWIERTTGGSSFSVVASSADGTKLAAGQNGGAMYTSTDSGVNWTEQTDAGTHNWTSLASSTDGTKLAVTVSGGSIYTSTDSGVNWTEQTDAGTHNWYSIASSADGTKLVASVNGGYIYTSTDSGVNWTEHDELGILAWYGISSSYDGTKLVSGIFNGYIYTSTDSGANWIEQTSAGSRPWMDVAMSSDGSKIIAAPFVSYLRTYGPLTAVNIETGDSSNINKTYVTLSGEILDIGSGGITERGFEYGPDTDYGSTRSSTGVYVEGEYDLLALNLTCATTYHFRAYAVNSFGTATGEDSTFSTSSCDAPDPSSVLYAVDGNGSSDEPHLYKLDPGSGTIIEDVGEVGYYVTGLAFHPETGVLYGSVGNTGASQRGLITINLETGAGTLLGIIKNGSNQTRTMPDLAFRSNGTLYGFSSQGEDLYTIDIDSCNGTTCLATMVGNADFNSSGGNGIAFDSEDNLYVFGQGDNSYFIVDPDTGLLIDEVDFSNPSGEFYNIPAAEFDGEGTLYVPIINYGSDPAVLATIDLETATITRLQENNPDMIYMDAIAFYINPVIEPTVTATPPVEISKNSATLEGEITDDGGADNTERGFNYGLDDSYGSTVSEEGTFNEEEFSLGIEGLKCHTTYHFQSFSTNTAGTAESDDETFETDRCATSGGSAPSSAFTTSPDFPVPVLTSPVIDLNCKEGEKYSSVNGQLCPPTINVTTPSTFIFQNNLSLKTIHPDVLQLQKYLNNHGYPLALTGPGSLGNETTKFGLLTYAALIKFQKDHGIIPSVGFFGPITRGIVNGNI